MTSKFLSNFFYRVYSWKYFYQCLDGQLFHVTEIVENLKSCSAARNFLFLYLHKFRCPNVVTSVTACFFKIKHNHHDLSGFPKKHKIYMVNAVVSITWSAFMGILVKSRRALNPNL